MKSQSRTLFRHVIAIMGLAFLSSSPGALAQQAQSQVMTTTTSDTEQAPKLPNDQLDSLVAPIALYSDPLLAQTLADERGVAHNPQDPDAPFDPSEHDEKKRVHRDGSFLCNDQYCSRYIVGTRGKGEVNTGTNHLRFRCVRSAENVTQLRTQN